MIPSNHLRWIASLPPEEVEKGARQKFILEQLWLEPGSKKAEWRQVPQVPYGTPKEVT